MKKAILHMLGLAATAALLCLACGDNGLDRSSDNNGDVDSFLNRINGIPDTTKTPDTTRGGTDEPSLVLAEGEAWVDNDSGLIFTSDGRLITIFKHDDIWLYGDTNRYTTTGKDTIDINSETGIYSISSGMLMITVLYTHPFTKTGDINPKTRYYLTISNNPNPGAGGSVSKNPDKEFYFFGEEVTVTALADTAATYRFAKWTGASTETTPAITITMDSDKTLTAEFELITYAIKFDAAGGNVNPTSGTTNVYYKLTSLPYPTRNGYIFLGWYTAAEGGTQVLPSMVFSADATLYARWEERSMVVYGPSVEHGGETYQTVVIGTQTWFARNLNYNVDGSKCYGEDGQVLGNDDYYVTLSTDEVQANCAKYGRLYSWAAAMDIDTIHNTYYWYGDDVKHQGVCPSGWHLPSDAEWTTLMDFVDSSSTAGTILKSASGWDGDGNGTDEYGFSALPGGYYGSRFQFVGNTGYWWSATEERYEGSTTGPAFGCIIYGSSNVYSTRFSKSTLLSARCVQD